eukprot:PITA_05519
MHSTISIVGIVLTGKDNYPDWSQMIQHTLIFNELWKGVCVREGDSDPEKPTLDKELAIWENKNNKAYELIVASVNKEVSRHISSYSTAFEALQKLKELYDSHSALEVVQLMIKLFTLELQNNDPLALAYEIKSIMHDIKSTKVELDIPFIAFLKALYPTYSNYLEFGMIECNPLTTPMEQNLKLTAIEGKEFEDATKYRQLVGSLNYLTTTRLDISFSVGILSRFMQKPCEGHWSTAKNVLSYLKGTQDFGIKYTQVDDFILIGYSDSEFDGDKETGVSTSGYAMSLGLGAVS